MDRYDMARLDRENVRWDFEAESGGLFGIIVRSLGSPTIPIKEQVWLSREEKEALFYLLYDAVRADWERSGRDIAELIRESE